MLFYVYSYLIVLICHTCLFSSTDMLPVTLCILSKNNKLCELTMATLVYEFFERTLLRIQVIPFASYVDKLVERVTLNLNPRYILGSLRKVRQIKTERIQPTLVIADTLGTVIWVIFLAPRNSGVREK